MAEITDRGRTWREWLGIDRDGFQASRVDYEISRRFMAVMVGAIAIGLPIILLITAQFSGCYLDSISHYFYSGYGGTIFTGALMFIGAFMLAYRDAPGVNFFASIGGICATCVALFPTSASGCDNGTALARPFTFVTTNPDVLAQQDGVKLTVENADLFFNPFTWVSTVHFASAGTLFLILAFFCLVVFTRRLPKHIIEDNRLTYQKSRRNRTYRICGVLIILSILALGGKSKLGPSGAAFWTDNNLTFWVETVALWSFGTSWILKGRLGFLSGSALGRYFNDADDVERPSRAAG